jgi:Mn-dependent DtxR family transcriptional regulator
MVTHDVDIARNAGRRIELTHGHVTLDTTCNFLEQPKLCPHGKPFPSSGCCTTLDSKSCTP